MSTIATDDKARDCLLLSFAAELLRAVAHDHARLMGGYPANVRLLPGAIVEAGAWTDTGEPYLSVYTADAVLAWMEGVEDLRPEMVAEWLVKRDLSQAKWETLCDVLTEEGWTAPEEEQS